MLESLPLPDGRLLTVYLPPRYTAQRPQRYPVLYLNDGQNVFDPARAFGGRPWRVAETATELIEAGRVEPLVIVGIDHTEQNRLNEYTPTSDRRRGGGGADGYVTLLAETIKPLVDATFHACAGARHTAIGGSSLGGLVALYLALERPDLFGRAAVLSPSVWWDRRSILREVRRARVIFAADPEARPRLWVDMGTHESRGAGSARRVVEDARLLKAGLVAAGWREGVDLHYQEIAGGTHTEEAWGNRFGRVLEWLFPNG